MPMSRRDWSDADDKYIRDNASSQDAAHFAARFGVSKSTIFRRCRRVGVSLRKAGDQAPDVRYSDAAIERARALRDKRLTLAEIAVKTGIPVNMVRKYVYFQARRYCDLRYDRRLHQSVGA